MFINEPPASPGRDALYQEDIDEDGFVWNNTRAWAWNPEAYRQFVELTGKVSEAAGLSFRDQGFLVSATASTISNSGCSLAWGNRLSTATSATTAVSVLSGSATDDMTERDRALTHWARKVADEPHAATQADVEQLRSAGLSDAEIFNTTFYVAMRVAFSTINDAMGAPLNSELLEDYDPGVVAAVDFGRAPG